MKGYGIGGGLGALYRRHNMIVQRVNQCCNDQNKGNIVLGVSVDLYFGTVTLFAEVPRH